MLPLVYKNGVKKEKYSYVLEYVVYSWIPLKEYTISWCNSGIEGKEVVARTEIDERDLFLPSSILKSKMSNNKGSV